MVRSLATIFSSNNLEPHGRPPPRRQSVEEFLEIGGEGERSVVEFGASMPSPAVVFVVEDREGVADATAAACSPLSLSHIGPEKKKNPVPSIRFAVGGSYVHVSLPGEKVAAKKRRERGRIGGFTASSRRRFLEALHSLDHAQVGPLLKLFITLTYPSRFPDPWEAKHDLKVFKKRLRRKYGPQAGFWKLEPQERGAPHFHLAIFMTGERRTEHVLKWVVTNWHKIAGRGDANHRKFHAGLLGNKPCVEEVKSMDQLMKYLAKYIGKKVEQVEGWDWPGRFWGRICKTELKKLSPVQSLDMSVEFLVKVKRDIRRFEEHRPNGKWRIDLGRLGIDRRFLTEEEIESRETNEVWRSMTRPYHVRAAHRGKSNPDGKRRLGGEIDRREARRRKDHCGIKSFMSASSIRRIILLHARELGLADEEFIAKLGTG